MKKKSTQIEDPDSFEDPDFSEVDDYYEGDSQLDTNRVCAVEAGLTPEEIDRSFPKGGSVSNDTIQKRLLSRSGTSGAAVYKDYRDNFTIWPGRESALDKFVNQTYGGRRHKLRHTKSSNSEDALTWSCFDTLNELSGTPRTNALAELWALAFDDGPAPAGFLSGRILVGERYGEKGEETEVDASLEGDRVLVFIEAKLYSSMSLADDANNKPHDQIARKLRVGLKEAQRSGKDFYFIILDIAPKEILRGLKPGASLSDAKRKLRGGFSSKSGSVMTILR